MVDNMGKTALAKLDFDNVVAKMGYTSSEYIKNKQQVDMCCDRGHKYKVTPHSFRTNPKCRTCHFEDVIIESKIKFVEYLNTIGYTLVGEFTGMRSKTLVKCNNGHVYKCTTDDLMHRGKMCRYCRADKFGSRFIYYAFISCGKYIKLGSTNNPHSRQGTLISQTPFAVGDITAFDVGSGGIALYIEERAKGICTKANLGKFCGHTEWFLYDAAMKNFLEGIKHGKPSIQLKMER